MLKKIPQSYKLLFWIPELGLLLALFLDCGNFALPAGGTVPRYQHSACVGVAFGVNYWQSTSSYEVKWFWRCKWLLSSSGASCPGCGSAGERERLTGGTCSTEAFSWDVGSTFRAGCSEQQVKLDYGTDGGRLTYFWFCCWPLIGCFLPCLTFSFSESAV